MLLLITAAAFSGGWLLGRDGIWEMGSLRPLLETVGWSEEASECSWQPNSLERFEPVRVASPGEARILFVGDVLPLQDRDYLTYASELISSADFAIGNLECPLSTHGTKTPLKLDERGRLMCNEFIFRAPPSQAKRMADAGFDAMTLANNHIMDYGGEALLETLRVLDEAGLVHTGAGPDIRAAREPMVFVVEGQTVAVLAYVSTATLPGTKHFRATHKDAGTVFVDGSRGEPTKHTRRMLRNDVRAAAKQSDFVIIAFHWGSEVTDEPDPLPQRLAHLCIEAGADMVIGHHPHKLQGVDTYNGKPIVYSLGNFVFPTKWKSNHFSAALELRLRNGRWRKLVFHPVKLRFRAGDPVPAQGADLHRIVRRATRLTKRLGTEYVCEDVDGSSRIIISNPSLPASRTALLKEEHEHFFFGAHPEISGMSTVHFLAWDIRNGEKTAIQRSVVVRRALAPEVLEIFKDIYLSPERFPIHDLVGYNYRTVAGGSGLSNHALGRAIDINREENPMIQGGEKFVHPDEPPYEPGEWRPGEDPYSIPPDGSVVKAFKSRGWRWGGDWYSCKDYQHFDKPG